MDAENLLAKLAHPLPRYTVRPEKTALVIVDMQYLDADPHWGLGNRAKELGIADHLAPYFERVRQITERIRRLREALRQSGGEVIYLALCALTENRRDACSRHYVMGLAPAKGSREAEIIEELTPGDEEILIHKSSSSPFNSTSIGQVLYNLGVELIIATGVVTNGCVEGTVRDAADRSYQVILVEDACTALTEELHANSIQSMRNTFANVLSTQEVLDELSVSVG
jgi:nicotinamidase-related amidase